MKQDHNLLPWHIRDSVIGLALLGTAILLSWWFYQTPRTIALTMDELPVMLPLEGLHEREGFPERAESYRWTTGAALLRPPNPGGAPWLHILMAGGTARTVPVQLGPNEPHLSFLVAPEPRTYSVLLPPQAGEQLHVQLDSPVIEARNRTLGVVVSSVQVSGGGAAPGMVLLALMVATIGGYAGLVMGQGLPRPVAASMIVLLQALALWWQVSVGWRYGLLVVLLSGAGVASLGAVVLERWKRSTAQHRSSLAQSTTGAEQTAGSVLLLVACFLLIRLPWLAASDPVGDLELAARRMAFLSEHGLVGAYMFGGDYMPLRLYLLYGLSHLVLPLGGGFHDPLPPVTLLLIKLPGLLADFVTLILIFTWSRHWCSLRRATLIALLYTLSPPVWINVAWWGQVDALLMLPLVAMLLLLDHASGRWSWLCWSAALLIKPQAIILAPLLYVCTVRRHGARGVIQGGGLAVALFIAAAIPLALVQQGPGLMQAYIGSVGRFPRLTAGAYNLWYLVTWGASGPDTGQGIGSLSFRQIGLLLVGMSALLVSVALLHRCDAYRRVIGAAVLGLAFFALPTQIHERYLFLSLAFLVLSLPLHKWMVLPYTILVITATLNILGDLRGFVPLAYAVLVGSAVPLVCAVVNLGVLGVLMWQLCTDDT